MAAQFQFVVRSGPNAGKAYPLEGAELTVGRDPSNPVSINDGEISRRHAKLSWKGASYVLEDLGSTNGSFVNGTRLSAPLALKPGDAVSFGENIVLIYEATFDANATMVGSAKAAKTAAPVQQAAPAPAPTPAYSGQVPASPAPAAAAPKKGGSRVVLIVIVLVVLCLILACVAAFLWVDADKTGARWCMFPFRFIAQMLGAVCQ
jgi:predicted component of type VI protein secretion system